MKYSFLHLSDLHYLSKRQENVQLVCRKFLEDLKSQRDKYENLYVIFSGDLVKAGGESALYDDFQAELASVLDSIGLDRGRRFCVPGNHDISQAALRPVL